MLRLYITQATSDQQAIVFYGTVRTSLVSLLRSQHLGSICCARFAMLCVLGSLDEHLDPCCTCSVLAGCSASTRTAETPATLMCTVPYRSRLQSLYVTWATCQVGAYQLSIPSLSCACECWPFSCHATLYATLQVHIPLDLQSCTRDHSQTRGCGCSMSGSAAHASEKPAQCQAKPP